MIIVEKETGKREEKEERIKRKQKHKTLPSAPFSYSLDLVFEV